MKGLRKSMVGRGKGAIFGFSLGRYMCCAHLHYITVLYYCMPVHSPYVRSDLPRAMVLFHNITLWMGSISFSAFQIV